MPRLTEDPELQLLLSRNGAVQGLVWGGLAGALIGAGISMTIGLFYSSPVSLIFTVIAVPAIIGALFGQVVAHLLSEDMTRSRRPSSYEAPHVLSLPALKAPSEYLSLRQNAVNVVGNQEIMAKVNNLRNHGAAFGTGYPQDDRMFELVMAGGKGR